MRLFLTWQRSLTCCSRLWGWHWSSFWAVLKCSCLDFFEDITDMVTPPDLLSWHGLHALLAVFKDAELWRQVCLDKAKKCFENIQIPLFLTAFLFFLIFCCFAAWGIKNIFWRQQILYLLLARDSMICIDGTMFSVNCWWGFCLCKLLHQARSRSAGNSLNLCELVGGPSSELPGCGLK